MSNVWLSPRSGCCFWSLTILALAVFVGFCNPSKVNAQVLYGSMVGNVSDPAGAVVPGATVTATSEGTGTVKSTTTDASGTYQFVNLQPGSYSLKVTIAGFKSYERLNLPVAANDVTRANITLEIGNVEQSVTVTDAPAATVV